MPSSGKSDLTDPRSGDADFGGRRSRRGARRRRVGGIQVPEASVGFRSGGAEARRHRAGGSL